ncbi:hypothetical protein LZA78_03410 [Sinirhodobacter sp. WL0062]|uniref:Uncharacterized protein n=1 Tax=Rhodobacter flavimaris TaxID=2907145 RepID=A0ABS8YUW2_9RHOB|nr:hypothetical protein [Sinirhodobacter sp. WL0062]MCE5972531.1 hypothetical protein [Sinirhodobacter sp. WL0062]
MAALLLRSRQKQDKSRPIYEDNTYQFLHDINRNDTAPCSAGIVIFPAGDRATRL